MPSAGSIWSINARGTANPFFSHARIATQVYVYICIFQIFFSSSHGNLGHHHHLLLLINYCSVLFRFVRTFPFLDPSAPTLIRSGSGLFFFNGFSRTWRFSARPGKLRTHYEVKYQFQYPQNRWMALNSFVAGCFTVGFCIRQRCQAKEKGCCPHSRKW